MATSSESDFQKDIEALRADITALTDTVGKLATEAVKVKSAIGGNMKTAAKKAGKLGEEFWEESQKLGSDTVEAASDAGEAGVASLERQIRKNPMSAVLIALGAGFVLGMFGHR